jgi:hypothetical protein
MKRIRTSIHATWTDMKNILVHIVEQGVTQITSLQCAASFYLLHVVDAFFTKVSSLSDGMCLVLVLLE